MQEVYFVLETQNSRLEIHRYKSEPIEDEKYYLLQLDNIDSDGRIDVSDKYYISKTEMKEKWKFF